MGKGIYIVPPKTDIIELREFIDLLASTDRRNPLEKNLPQLSIGKKVAIHLEDVDIDPKRKESYLLNGRFESNVKSLAERLGSTFDVRYGIQPLVNKDGIVTNIKHYAVVKKIWR